MGIGPSINWTQKYDFINKYRTSLARKNINPFMVGSILLVFEKAVMLVHMKDFETNSQ